MNFANITGELNIEQAKDIVDSILNSGYWANIVIDKNTFEILYQNDKAIELVGDKLGCNCYEVLCTREVPCMDCPMSVIQDGPITRDRYEDLFDKNVRWQYVNISWFDGREAILATLLTIDDGTELIAAGMADNFTEYYSSNRRKIDELTRISNYSKFYMDVEHTLRSNLDKEYAIIVFDIDRLKSINDLYGMLKGDEVLKYVGTVLRGMFDDDTCYGRLHSDFFAICMSYKKKGDIIKTIEKLRKRFNAYSNKNDFDINTTYGIYLVNDRMVPANLMCDRAMMAARTIKGNIIKFCSFYDEQYRMDMLKANEIEREMNHALDNGEFKMYLQPKFNLKNEDLCGAEVLCRWIHPTKGIIPPAEFIPLFEKNGFILKLDEYMWEEACRTIRRWKDEGRDPVPLSVNISRYHIMNNDLEKVFTGLLDKYDLQPSALTLEITESLFLDKPEELNRVLTKLQKIGFRLEVDDFGSGFSSLNLIRNISVDTIKIDKDFLDSEIATEKGKIVINHTISMAKDLQLQVIAEGVETKEHVEFLKKSNCDIAQGFFFARPMPV
ncbi:MAG: putative bifunctional diguanylate cyclase/phosphodiesterase, partial [Wujia sp.]